MNPSISSKKENNFQKLNKQSTMLYLHHHPQGQTHQIAPLANGGLTNTLISNELSSGNHIPLKSTNSGSNSFIMPTKSN
jgi:hypothetical protein